MSDIKKLLADSLTKSDFDALPQTLKITPNLLTVMLKNPGRFEMEHIRKISELTRVPCYVLVFDYKLGFGRFTGPQLDNIAKEAGYTLGLIKEAA